MIKSYHQHKQNSTYIMNISIAKLPAHQSKIKTIGIVGHTGVVGSSMFRYFLKKGVHKVFGYSKDLRKNYPNTPLSTLNQMADIIFISVPTPYKSGNAGHDLSALHDVLNKLQPNTLAVIRSTVVPQTTENLQKRYEKIFLLYNPEFLSERTASYDFAHPDRQIVGFTTKSKGAARKVLQLLPKAPYSLITSSTEAEIVKYASTLFAVVKIIFANELYDLCESCSSDYSRILKAFSASKWLTTRHATSYMDIFNKGYRGYNGRCFPKDIDAILQFAENKHLKSDLIQTVQRINTALLKKQKI